MRESAYLTLMMALVGRNMSLGQQALQIGICDTPLKTGYFNQQNVNICTFVANIYEGWNFNSGNYLFTTDTK